MRRPRLVRRKLKNGSQLAHILMPDASSGTIAAFVRAGNRFDPRNYSGLAHFMEHMTLSGTKKYPSAIQLHMALERYGAWYEAFTYPDYVYFTIKFAGDCLEPMIENLAERLAHPLFKTEDREETKGNILQELYLNSGNPERKIWDLWGETIWQETLLARKYTGTENSLERINRNSLIDFYKNYYGFNNTVFFYAGCEMVEKTEKLFSDYFENYNNQAKREFPQIAPRRQNPTKINQSSDEQITFAYGFKTEGLASPDYPILELLQVILGIGWSSRLGKKLFLENGLVYEWLMNYHQLLDNGYLMYQSATQKENFNKVLNIITEEITDIKNNGVKKAEFDKAKSYYQGNLLANTETPMDFVHWYARQELFLPDKVEDLDDRIKKIKMVTKEDIIRVAQKYFTDKNWYLALIGNMKEKEIKIAI